MTDRRLHADPRSALDRSFRDQAETARLAARTGQANGLSSFDAIGLPLVVEGLKGWRWREDYLADPAGELVLERYDSGTWTEIVRF